MASALQITQTLVDDDRVYGTRKVQVAILASEWGSSKGGLSTISRELAIQLAKCPEVEITFFLPQCSQEDRRIALEHNVKIVEAKPRPGFDQLDWLCFPPKDLQIDIIFGNGVKLGKQAQVIKDLKDCKWVQVVHSDPEELGMFKNYSNPISKGEEKHKTEVELCEMADLVVGVGPKLSEAFRSYLRGCQKDDDVLDLTPGVFEAFETVRQVPSERHQFSVLVFGRGDEEDFKLKGFDIAGKAVAALQDTRLVFVGAPDGKHEEIAERLTEYGLPASRLRVRGFVHERESLRRLFQEVDLVVMPSRTEGFGLTGLEALSAGLPVLVSQNSGFGEALCSVPFGSIFVINSEDPGDWTSAIKKIWAKDRKSRLEEAEALRFSYGRKYDWGKQLKDLIKKMMSWTHARLRLSIDCKEIVDLGPQGGPTRMKAQETACLSFTSGQRQTVATAGPPKERTSVVSALVESQEDVQRVAVVSGSSGTPREEVSSGSRREDVESGAIPSPQDVLSLISSKYLRKLDPSTPEEFNGFLHYMERIRKAVIVDVGTGSLIVTIECGSLEILEGLWKDYIAGCLNEMAQRFLVTEEILEELGLAEVKLTTTIKEEEYRACHELLTKIAEKGQDLLKGKLETVVTPRKRKREFSVTPSRETHQGEENLDRQLREMNLREENSQRQLSKMQKHEKVLQIRLRGMQERVEYSHTLWRGMGHRKEYLLSHLRELLQREGITERQTNEIADCQKRLQLQLREMQYQNQVFQSQLWEMPQSKKNPEMQRQLREIKQREETLQRQEREIHHREGTSERQMSAIQQSEENSQRHLSEMEQGEESLQKQLKEKHEHQENVYIQLREMNRGEENSERQMRETQSGNMLQLEESLERQLSELRRVVQHDENLEREVGKILQLKADSERKMGEMQERQERLHLQLSEIQHQNQIFQDQLWKMLQRKKNPERQMSVTQDREENSREKEELSKLTTAQQTISEMRRRETGDWVIARNEIHVTDKCLGKGEWCVVYEGVYCGSSVAVKQFHDFLITLYDVRLFEREMNIASKCRHPHLLRFYGATNDEENPLSVFELMDISLRTLLEQRQLSETEVSLISLDVARALNYLHQKKPVPLIHQNVSSANVLLWQKDDQWRGKVSGYSCVDFMQETMIVAPGNTLYSAPEAFTPSYTVKVDVYSFGVLLCEMCIRQCPDPGRREEQVMLVRNDAFRGLIRRCLRTDPEARPTMRGIIDGLEEFSEASVLKELDIKKRGGLSAYLQKLMSTSFSSSKT